MANYVPKTYTFPSVISGDGLKPFEFQFLDHNKLPLNIATSKLTLDLITYSGELKYRFSTDLSGANQLTVLDNSTIEFPEIKSWNIKSGTYKYEFKGVDPSGFVTTYYIGEWWIRPSLNEIEDQEYTPPPIPETAIPTSSENTFIII